MKISEYYQGFCEQSHRIDTLVKTESRPLVRYQALMDACAQLKSSTPSDIADVEEKFFRSKYRRDWFSFDWQFEAAIKDDASCIRRFLTWVGDCSILETCRSISVKVDGLQDGSDRLTDTVGLIVQWENGNYGAILPFFKKTDKSLYGKNIHTAINTDLHAMCAKAALEPLYPGIIVSCVYLVNEGDVPGHLMEKLSVGNTKKSNVFSLDFKGYMENGDFQMDFFLDTLQQVVASPVVRDCNCCRVKELCQKNSVMVTEPVRGKTDSSYSLPDFTKRQQYVIEHMDGPMLVCAGPGSGKTATLVGRVRHLVEEGIPPEVILVITFTNEAADELRNRCLSFCQPDSIPKISTINALGYEILRNNAELMDRGINLMKQSDQLQLVKALLSVTPQLSGIRYGSEGGRYGLLRTVLSKIEKYISCATQEEFFIKEPSLDTGFVALAEQYKAIIRARGYISFDEQVTLCSKLFQEHPELLSIYQHLYRYVMVDEFQDVNEDQARFVYAVAAHGNIVAVGDDDQSVYGFRGASNRYMLSFGDSFPGAETVVLNENFRSVQSLVDASQRLIGNNVSRIPKDIVSTRQGSAKPVLIESSKAAAFDAVITECLREGYKLEDIAILSTKNAPLERLHKDISVKTVLAKSFLRDDALFRVIYDVLMLNRDIRDEVALFHLLGVFQADVSRIHRIQNQTLYEALLSLGYTDVHDYASYNVEVEQDAVYTCLRFISTCMCLIEQKPTATFLLQNVAYYMRWENASSFSVFYDLLDKEKIMDTDSLFEHMRYMIEYEDDTRVEVSNHGAVLLITSHESKGREFPVVLMLDNYKENTEETRRLFYVAMTRAKDRLFIFKDTGSDQFLSELPELERMVC